MAIIEPACVAINQPSRQHLAQGDIGTQDARNVSVAANAPNTFWAKPSGTSGVRDGDISAEFAMSNWGTLVAPAEWVKLPTNRAFYSESSGTLVGDCVNGNTFGGVCGKPVDTRCDIVNGTPQCDPRWHQCMLASLNFATAEAAQRLNFTNASAYNNTLFVPLSSRSMIAQVDVKGLRAVFNNDNPRDVYLQVIPRQMPAAGNVELPELDNAANEALRYQVDLGFRNEVDCEDPGDVCYQDTCSYACDPGSEFGPCSGQDTPISTPQGCLCRPAGGEACRSLPPRAPACGGVDPDVTALEGEQLLRKCMPTLDVFPYYDSGKTKTVNGVARKILVPMPTFSVMASHEGDLYGFTQRLVNEDGSDPTPGGTAAPLGRLEMVGTNFYRIRVPSESTAHIRVAVSAEEAPYFTPMYQIVGTATPLPLGLGNATFTGVIQSTKAVDLSKATVVISKLLVENGTELATNFKGPVTLTRLGGATSTLAAFSYVKWGAPTVTMQVATLPFLGQTFSFQVLGASVRVPSACGLFGGIATLTTEFTLRDTNVNLPVRGTDGWGCLPGQLLNL